MGKSNLKQHERQQYAVQSSSKVRKQARKFEGRIFTLLLTFHNGTSFLEQKLMRWKEKNLIFLQNLIKIDQNTGKVLKGIFRLWFERKVFLFFSSGLSCFWIVNVIKLVFQMPWGAPGRGAPKCTSWGPKILLHISRLKILLNISRPKILLNISRPKILLHILSRKFQLYK